MTGESGWLSLRSLGAGGTMLVTGCWDAGSDVGFMGSVGMGWFWLGVRVGFQISDWMFQNVKCDISGGSRRFQVEGFRFQAKRLWV